MYANAYRPYFFYLQYALVHPHIPHISFHKAGHTGYGLLLVGFSAHTVQVEKEAYHKVAAQHHASYIFNVVVAIVTGYTLVLVQQVIYTKLQLPVLLFEQLFADTGIPQRDTLVESFCTACVDIIIKITGKNNTRFFKCISYIQ